MQNGLTCGIQRDKIRASPVGKEKRTWKQTYGAEL